jgi:hypothetical protein
MYRRRLVPDDFVVPLKLETSEFRLRPLTINDVIKDFDAVMTSVDHLRTIFNDGTDWPDGLTLEDDLIDLGWHHREFTIRHSFAYTVVSLDERRCLGCVYIYPSSDPGHDAEAFYWARQSELASGLEERLGATFRDWLKRDWPFKRVAYPGR